jgi:diguanylate cyclase (GGDEF)-like protein
MDVETWVQALTLASALTALAWAVAAGPLRIHSRATEKFLAFNLLMTVGLALWWLLPVPKEVQPVYLVVAGLSLILTGLQWLGLGVHRLYDTKPTAAVEPMALLVFVVVLLGVAAYDASGRLVVMGFFVICIWVLSATVQQAYPMLKATGGVQVANWGLLTPVLVALLCFWGVGRAVWLGAHLPRSHGLATSTAAQLLDTGYVVMLFALWLMLNAAVASLLMLRLMDKVRDLTREDELTGALNIRSFVAMLNTERERQRRQTQRQVLLVCQIDQLQSLSRQLGLEAGNMALRHVTHLFVKSQRTTDRLGRSPRNEFLLFLPDASVVGAKLVADRVQTAIKSHPLLINGQPIMLSLSIGLAERHHANLSSEALLELGRHAMQQAVRDGGGCMRMGPVMTAPGGGRDANPDGSTVQTKA